MLNITNKSGKRHLCTFENEPPDKKLVSDADTFIKQLAEKQSNTKTNLFEQLNSRKDFQKYSEFQPLTNYTAGCSSLGEFTEISANYEQVEKLKSFDLSKDEINLYLDSEISIDYVRSKHKNINKEILNSELKKIREKLVTKTEKASPKENNRLITEHVLSTKPNSMETKLLKFVIENKSKKEAIPHPMDNLKSVEQELFKQEKNINIKQIRKTARSLNNQINVLSQKIEEIPNISVRNSISFVDNSQWDVKEKNEIQPKIGKVYTCKQQNLYTIQNGQIVKLNNVNLNEGNKVKLSENEIKQIEKFKNYQRGIASKTLFIKNIAKGVTKNDLQLMFCNFEGFLNVELMKGKMRGQAFVKFTTEDFAAKALSQVNGTIIKDKPLVIMFGKR